ncbi:putative reverse transcriptase domain-containing protein [Tanacetum coccineum]
MSDSEDSTVTYTEVSSPFADLSNIGSPGVDGPPVMPEDPYAYVVAAFQAPPSPDYVPGLEEPEQAPPSPVYVPYVPKPVYPEFMPPEDEVFPAEEQPLPAALSPTADSPGYIVDSDPEEDSKEDPTDYPADGGDNDNDDADESSDDEKDDDVEEDKEDEEEEEEHPAPADSVLPPVYRVTGRMSVRAQTPISLPLDIEIPSPPLPLILSPLPASPPLLVSSPPPLASPTYPLGYRAAMIWLRAEAPSTSHPPPSSTPPSGTPPLLPISLPTPSPPLMLPSTDHRTDRPKVCLQPRKRLCIAFGPRYEVKESSSAPAARPTRGFTADYGFIATLDREIRRDPERDVGYRITDTWDEMLVDMPGAPATDDTELGWRMTDLVTTVRQDTDKIYGRLDDAKSEQHLMTGQLNILRRDRTTHTRITLLMEREARLSREAWRRSMDASDFARSEVSSLQIQVTVLQGKQGPARGPTQPKISEEAAIIQERVERVAQECTYQDFMKYQPLLFKGTEGVVELTQWTVGHDVTYAMTWTDLKKKMTDKYCPRGEIKKLEAELWNLKVKGTDVLGYNQHFQELALLCVRMFPKESDKIERYVGGLPDMIHGSVVASKPKTMQEAIEMATELMDKKINTIAERHAENKRKFDDTSKNNEIQQQQQNKRQNTVKAYTAGPGERKPYGGSKPLCPKCNYHHDIPCAPKFHKCNRVSHLACDCKSPANANTANNQRGTRAGQNPTCYECGVQGHFKRECPKIKNKNRGNPVGSGNTPAKVYAVGNTGTNPDSNVVTGTFLLNKRYASILFNTDADRSFVSTAFRS